jgi:hypothetical protein
MQGYQADTPARGSMCTGGRESLARFSRRSDRTGTAGNKAYARNDAASPYITER